MTDSRFRNFNKSADPPCMPTDYRRRPSSLHAPRRPRRTARLAILGFAMLSCVVLTTLPAGAAVSASTPAGKGWIRFAHFVSNAPPVDVKVDGTTIGTDVGFRDVTGYVLISAGVHTIAVFSPTAGAGAAPIVSGQATVPSGGAVTVAAFASTGATSSGSGSVAGGVPRRDDQRVQNTFGAHRPGRLQTGVSLRPACCRHISGGGQSPKRVVGGRGE
jgi:hypothetical protein